MSLLQVQHVKKIYTTRFGGQQVRALSDVNFEVEVGEFVAIMGESGSGKTTLLNIVATLDKPSAGKILLLQQDMAGIPDAKRAAFRRDHLGFVFQDFNLLDTFSVRDNILLPLVLARVPLAEMELRLQPLAEQLQLQGILQQYPYEISGGQKQRTAIARALITKPKILLADEPTGALDSRTSENLLQLFRQINQNGQTILMVTHSTKAASHANRVLFIKDGTVYHQLYRTEQPQELFYQKIADSLTVLSSGGNTL